MIKEELIAKSPVRILEKSIEGGLKSGNIGVIASRKGVGKTAVLVQIALDRLMQGEKVIHVSFSANTGYVISWYENILDELMREMDSAASVDIKDDLIKNRVIMNFAQETVSTEQIVRSLRAMMVDGGFTASTIIVDGYDFSHSSPEKMSTVRDFAREMGISIWYSCTYSGAAPHLDEHNVPFVLRDYLPFLDAVIVLEPKPEYIHFMTVKAGERLNPHDLDLKLDTRTLLITQL